MPDVTLMRPPSMDDDAIRMVMLHDSQGKLLVLLPEKNLLNLVSVWKQTGRHLQPISNRDSIKIFSQQALDSDKGVRQLLTLPMLIDADCCRADELTLTEPSSGRRLRISRDQIPNEAERCRLGVTPDAINAKQPQGNDVSVIGHAVEKFTALRIRQRLEDTLNLPTLAPTAQKIIALRTNASAGVDDLVPIVKLDPSLAAQVMSWAASPYYAAPGGIDSIHDAIVRVLGYDLVVNLTLGIAMGKTLALPKDSSRGGTPYWLQAIYCATLSEKLATRMPSAIRPGPGLAYLCGLLSNFGVLALSHIFPPHFSLVSRYTEANPHMDHALIEKQIINVTREQIASWLTEIWKLPAQVTHAIRHQGDLTYEGEHKEYALLLNLTQRKLREHHIGDGPVGAIPQHLYRDLQLEPETVEAVFAEIHNREEDLVEMTKILQRP